MNRDLIKTYESLINEGSIVNDPCQRRVLPYLQRILEQYQANKRWWRKGLKLKKTIKGLYFYGGVGVGKTFLMDLFFAALPGRRKRREHFHEFMRDVHELMSAFEGQVNPLKKVAKGLAKEIDLLCLDECVVNDIGDAMILERLFTTLFQKGVVLVTTSNFAPDDLYLEGLHRKRFLSAIELIKHSCTVLPVLSKFDHRKALFERAGTFIAPLDENSDKTLEQFFRSFSTKEIPQFPCEFELGGRTLQAKAKGQTVIWFEFDKLCSSPRSQLDYLKLADEFDVFILSKVPKIKADDLSTITYFILLIDVLYDKKRALILSAEAQVEALYPEDGKKGFEYQRTVSRLKEMGSKTYLNEALSNENENHY